MPRSPLPNWAVSLSPPPPPIIVVVVESSSLPQAARNAAAAAEPPVRAMNWRRETFCLLSDISSSPRWFALPLPLYAPPSSPDHCGFLPDRRAESRGDPKAAWGRMQGMGSTRPSVGAAPLVLAIAVLVVGCGGGDDGADRTSTSAEAAGGSGTVTIRDYTYEPAEITVPKGTAVTFVNRDSTPHTATSKDPGRFESGSLGTGKSGE